MSQHESSNGIPNCDPSTRKCQLQVEPKRSFERDHSLLFLLLVLPEPTRIRLEDEIRMPHFVEVRQSNKQKVTEINLGIINNVIIHSFNANLIEQWQ